MAEPEQDSQLQLILEERKLLLEEWKTVIQTQMHFNEMIIRARTTGVSTVIAVYGAAGIAIGQYPGRFIPVSNYPVHVSVPIVGFGLLLLLAIFILDYGYYYRLLLASVERGEQIDNAFRDVRIAHTTLFGMTTQISRNVSRCRALTSLLLFYGIPAIAGVLSLVYLLWGYAQIAPGANT